MNKEKLPTAEKSFEKTARKLGYNTWADLKNAFCMSPFELNDRIYKAAEEYKDLHTAPLLERIEELEAWKESANKVLNEIDLQECGKLLNVGLGQNIAINIVPNIKKLKAENGRLKVALKFVLERFKRYQNYDFDSRESIISTIKEALKGETK